MVTIAIRLPEGALYYPASASSVDLPALNLPTRFNVLFRQHADVSLLRRHVALRKGTQASHPHQPFLPPLENVYFFFYDGFCDLGLGGLFVAFFIGEVYTH